MLRGEPRTDWATKTHHKAVKGIDGVRWAETVYQSHAYIIRDVALARWLQTLGDTWSQRRRSSLSMVFASFASCSFRLLIFRLFVFSSTLRLFGAIPDFFRRFDLSFFRVLWFLAQISIQHHFSTFRVFTFRVPFGILGVSASTSVRTHRWSPHNTPNNPKPSSLSHSTPYNQ